MYNPRTYFIGVLTLLTVHVASAQDKVVAIAEYMPSLEGCQTIKDRSKRGDCTREKITAHLNENLKLPKEMTEAGVEGVAVIEIVIDAEGDVAELSVVDDPGYGMSDAAMKALKKLKSWYPAEHFGEKVAARMKIPVQFSMPDAEDEDDGTSELAVNTDEVYKVVEEMPAWTGCTGDDAKNCTFQALTTYFMDNLEYPDEAKTNGVEGTVLTQFVIDEEGKVTQVQLIEGLGHGCDEEAVRLIENMPAWISGKQRGVPVKVQMNVPVRFMLRTKE